MNARAVPSFAAAAGRRREPRRHGESIGFGSKSGIIAATQASPYPGSNGDANAIDRCNCAKFRGAPAVSIPHANIPALKRAASGPAPAPTGGLSSPARLCVLSRSVSPSSPHRLSEPPSIRQRPRLSPATRSATNWAANFSSASDAPGRLPHPDEIADLKPLGQVSASFIIAVNGEGLWIVDQHVAHERVLFEQHLEARRAGKVESQRMLMPMILELAPRQLVIYEKIADELTANGFEVEPMGPRSVAIQAIPAGVTGNDAEKLLTEILDGIERENAAISIETLQAKIAASTACHAAIKVNMPLDQTKMEWLLAALAKTDCPMSCPHGRPVVLRYSVKEIERAFHRI